MKRSSLMLASLLLSTSALAQSTPAEPARPMHHRADPFMGADTNKDGAVSREEAQAQFNKRFDAMDQNKDGKVTPEEMRAARETMHRERMAHARARFEERFQKADANHDGMLSRPEAQAGMPELARRFDRLDTNKDGLVNMEELRQAAHQRRGPMHRPPAPRS